MIHPPALTIIVGPDDHGVVRHASVVATAAGSPVRRMRRTVDLDHAINPGSIDTASSNHGVVHFHFTDRLFGEDATSAASRFRRLTQCCRGRVAVSLHDVPFDDGTPHADRRRAAYRVVVACADTTLVASRVERVRLHSLDVDAAIRIIPLPVIPLSSPPPRSPGPLSRSAVAGPPQRPIVAVVGFVYPGKGHAELIDAAALLRSPVRVVALGRCSDGHEHMAGDLTQRAAAYGVGFEVTGHLDDQNLADAMTDADVPIVPAPRSSASASLQTWIGAGRRPLVAENDYTVEVAAALPGAFVRYNAASAVELAGRLEVALTQPRTTWRTAPPPDHLSIERVAAAHQAVYRSLAKSAST